MVNRKNVEYNLKPFKKILAEIKRHDFSALSRDEVAVRSASLRERSRSGEPFKSLMPEAFALVSRAVKLALDITPFDVQLMSAAAMADGHIIELPTGEGKTLAAVFTAYLASLTGGGVHVLTFNDYLARRDALWMKPVYDLLGTTAAFVGEGMDKPTRKAAYGADVTYVTAKEAGFDYLRGFLAFDSGELVQRQFDFAIIDEADSILIDEARVPLVIAGDDPSAPEMNEKIQAAAAEMTRGVHFDTDDHDTNIFLTDAGIALCEARLGIESLYAGENFELLTNITVVLQARFLLERDVDYIVRGGEILIVDEFTGRVAKNRQWSDGLHAAVEMKEGLTPKNHGRVMNSVTLQNFVLLYRDFCGMTGTAVSAATEFHEFYSKNVVVIPPNTPCARVDHDDVIFTHKESKYRAVIGEIVRTHKTGRPVLVGTCSVEESERIAEMLRGEIGEVSVLNAKNDAREAAIIAEAGRLNAVTISTNMAGRGVDIRLGADDTDEHDAVCALGGLYIIGTNRHESVRIDNQLRGRAGRQGDPGESRFFVSLEDNLVVRYGLFDVLPDRYKNLRQDESIEGKDLKRAILQTQRVIEGRVFDAKLTLFKYSRLLEEQRQPVHQKREEILLGERALGFLQKEDEEKYNEILSQITTDEFERAQRQVELYAVNKCWADYLAYMEGALEEVPILSSVRDDSYLYFNRRLSEGFENLGQEIKSAALDAFDRVVIREGRIDLPAMGIGGATSTRTYMVHDGTEQMLMGTLGNIVGAFTLPFKTRRKGR
ncbi:MAG: accessory Sec system translocase SecA2 [Oscillospiraceae bacterium]|nr:accessory Sec system translocase SecA2 [Oscillospiraceae bacterium]